MDTLTPASEQPSRRVKPRWIGLRLAMAAILLLPAFWFSWLTIDGLNSRRQLRTDLAELGHVRYGMLNADRWRAIIGPILDAQIDKLDLNGQSKSLRPMVERSLYQLLDNIKQQMTAPLPQPKVVPPANGTPQPGGTPPPKAAPKPPAMPGQGNPFLVNMIIGSLRPHVPEYTNVVMAELTNPANQTAFKDAIRGVMADGVKNSFGAVDMTGYTAILERHGCSTAADCEQTLGKQIAEADTRLTRDYRIVLASAALGFALLMIAGGTRISRLAVLVLMLFSIAMLVGGVLSPMLEVEVRITRLDAMLMGHPIEFQEQSLYFRSKTVLEVFQSLLEIHRPEMTLVAVLVLLFSVVFPALKMGALGACLLRPSLLANRVVRLFAFALSKWSMADVMVLAIFMSFVAFNGVIGGGMQGVRDVVGELVIPTNASKILPGYYLFIGFCLASIVLSKKLEQGIASGSAIESASLSSK